jgi:hypothetical protein
MVTVHVQFSSCWNTVSQSETAMYTTDRDEQALHLHQIDSVSNANAFTIIKSQCTESACVLCIMLHCLSYA